MSEVYIDSVRVIWESDSDALTYTPGDDEDRTRWSVHAEAKLGYRLHRDGWQYIGRIVSGGLHGIDLGDLDPTDGADISERPEDDPQVVYAGELERQEYEILVDLLGLLGFDEFQCREGRRRSFQGESRFA